MSRTLRIFLLGVLISGCIGISLASAEKVVSVLMPTGTAGCAADEVCVEWCTLTADGLIPTGIRCCVPVYDLKSGKATSCSGYAARADPP